MFRNRYKAWVLCVILAMVTFAVSYLVKQNAINESNKSYVTAYVDSKGYLAKKNIEDGNYSGVELTVSSVSDYKPPNKSEGNDTIFITDRKTSFNKLSEDFLYEKEVGYSPMVILYSDKKLKNSTQFVVTANSANYDVWNVNLKKILDAMLEGKLWADIGFEERKDIKIVIPSSDTIYYEFVVKLLYVTYNEGKDVTESDYTRLKPTIDEILSKCEQVNNFSSYLKENKRNQANMYIIPEIMFFEESIKDSVGDGLLNLVYPKYNIKIQFMMYYNNPKILDSLVKGLNNIGILEMNSVIGRIGYRENDAKQSVSERYNSRNHASDEFQFVNLDDEVETSIMMHY